MVKEISGPTLKRWLDAGNELFLVDARDPAAYRKGHLPKAVSLLLAEIDQKAGKLLSIGVPVVVYSNDADCPASGLVAAKLESLGYGPVYDYNPSYADWISRGYLIVSS